MLVLDRFLTSSSSALDLATGQRVRLRVSPRPTSTPLFCCRGRWCLVDAGPRPARSFVEAWECWQAPPPAAGAPIDVVREALAGARDGHPRAVDVTTGDARQWQRTARDIARDARMAGFVPIAAEVLGELLRASRWQWPRWLIDRSLVVLTCDGHVSADAALALLRLASRDARPHVVVRGTTNAMTRPSRLIREAWTVHEHGAEGGSAGSDASSPGALAESAWRRAEAGDSDDEAVAAARWAVLLAPTVETEATARAALATLLVTQGRRLEARAALPGQTTAATDSAKGERAMAGDYLRLVEVCQQVEDEATSLGRVLVFLRDRLAAGGLAVVVADHGQLRTVAQVGVLTDSLDGASQALTTGLAVLPRDRSAGDGAWPVRYAGAVVGALWGHWCAGMPVMPADAGALMGVAAAAVAPLVCAVAERGRAIAGAPEIPDLVGDSEIMRALRAALLRAARSPFPVLIEGESGSGKELVARAIHRASPRRDRRFSALNCAALSEELAETELFGHARGAFTGAVAERAGLFEEANGGTLFLDEVSELSARIQAKLLRVLQEHEVRRLGEGHVRRIDARIVAATNRPLSAEVEAGRFRRDLRYRLDVVRLTIPPLRERLEDVPALVRHVWSGLCEKTGSHAMLSPSVLAALGRYDWPGNVREMQNVLASLIVTCASRGPVSAGQLPAHVARSAALAGGGSLADARREFEARYVRAALARAEGRPGAAARALGVSRQGLAKVIARLGLVGPGAGGECRRV